MEEYFTIILEAGERERKKEGGERMREKRERERAAFPTTNRLLTIPYLSRLLFIHPGHVSATLSISVALLGKLKVIIHCTEWSYFN